MRLTQLLFTQGFGTRRQCEALVAGGHVQIGDTTVRDDVEVQARGLVWRVDGVAWSYHLKALLLLHKPAGYECSMKPKHHPGVLSLLPMPLRTRGVQPVGRLDVDTTGLLLLTDDGTLLHRLTSPKHHVAKVYQATTKHAITPSQVQQLLDGVVLGDHPTPVRALACTQRSDHTLTLTIDQGRYHQVKRMLAAVGNRVTFLHRSAFGDCTLPNALPPGQWCWIDPGKVVGEANAET